MSNSIYSVTNPFITDSVSFDPNNVGPVPSQPDCQHDHVGTHILPPPPLTWFLRYGRGNVRQSNEVKTWGNEVKSESNEVKGGGNEVGDDSDDILWQCKISADLQKSFTSQFPQDFDVQTF